MGAQNRSNQMKGYARIWKWVQVLDKLTITYITICYKIKIVKIGVTRFQEIPPKIILGDNRGTKILAKIWSVTILFVALYIDKPSANLF